MHTEPTASRVEQYITAHRARLAFGVAALLTVLAYTVWAVLSRTVWLIMSPSLDTCVFALSLAASAIAALAFYWGAE